MKQLIHKTCAVVVKDNKILLVRKKGKDIWTGLGGRVEKGETEEECLLREIKEEINTNARIIKKIGDFDWGYSIFCATIAGVFCLGFSLLALMPVWLASIIGSLVFLLILGGLFALECKK